MTKQIISPAFVKRVEDYGTKLEGRKTAIGRTCLSLLHPKLDTAYHAFKHNGEKIAKMEEELGEQTRLCQDLASKHGALIGQLDRLKQNAELDSKLFRMVVHDVGGPLGMVDQYWDYLLGPNISAEKKEAGFEYIRSTLKHIYNLLTELREWKQDGNGAFRWEEVNLYSKTDEKLMLLGIAAEKKGITFENRLPPATMLFGDSTAIGQIVQNLVGNAIKFTPDGGKITVGAKPAQGGFLEVTVSDTGVGMEPKTVKSLFNLDVEIKFTTDGTRGEKGSGLGLLIAHDFVNRHGGKIWVESEVGKGSAFHFTLPEYAGQACENRE